MTKPKAGKKYTIVWKAGIARGVKVEKVEHGMAVGKNPRGDTVSYSLSDHEFFQER